MKLKELNIVRTSNLMFTVFTSVIRSFTLPIVCIWSFFTYAQVSTSIDTTQIRIGEEVGYIIHVEADSTDLVVFPEGQTFLPVEVINSYKVDTTYKNAKYQLLKKYGLTQFDSGSYTIPTQRIFINENAFNTDSIQIEVKDVAVDTTKQKMFDIKPVITVQSPPFDFLKLLYWLLLILIIGGFVSFVF